MMIFFSFSIILVVPLLASALITPHARDNSLVARHHHHLARQANGHSLARRFARRKRCLHRSTFPSSSSLSSSPSSSSYSPAVITTATTTSRDPVLDLPINVAPLPATTTTTTTPEQPAYTPPPQDHTVAASSSTGSGETHVGEGTFFDVGLGSCGKTSANTDYMVAIGWELYDSFATGASVGNPNLNPVCGRQIRASYGGKSVTVVALDRCGGCKRHDLDFSPAAFSQLADQGLGRLKNVEWQFV